MSAINRIFESIKKKKQSIHMKRILLAFFATALCAAASADNIRFASHPSLSPDGKQIYFSYDGDI